MAAKGKSTIDVEVNTSALTALVELAERYKATLEESNKLLKTQADLYKQVHTAQEKLNRTVDSGAKSRSEHRRREKSEEDLFPEGKRYRAASTGAFTKRPIWGAPRDSTGSGQFAAGWAKAPPPGSLSGNGQITLGPGTNRTGSGQFQGGWGKPWRL